MGGQSGAAGGKALRHLILGPDLPNNRLLFFSPLCIPLFCLFEALSASKIKNALDWETVKGTDSEDCLPLLAALTALVEISSEKIGRQHLES